MANWTFTCSCGHRASLPLPKVEHICTVCSGVMGLASDNELLMWDQEHFKHHYKPYFDRGLGEYCPTYEHRENAINRQAERLKREGRGFYSPHENKPYVE